MNRQNLTYSGLIRLLFFFLPFCSTAQVSIIESQSFNALHRMDIRWEKAATDLGLNSTIHNATFLSDANNLNNTDILIISSAVISLDASQINNIYQFVLNGGNLYVQSEYLMTAQGNYTFSNLINQLGGNFTWDGETNGQLSPMTLNSVMSEQDSLLYFWYGAYGSGDANTIPFIHKNGLNYGFIYAPSRTDVGQIVTTSDQDWVRLNKNPRLLEEILCYLRNDRMMLSPPQILVDASVDRPCNGETITFSALVSDTTGNETYQWLVNGQAVNGANGLNWTFDNYQDGDVVECLLQLDYGCGNYEKLSNQFLIDPITTLVAELPVVNPVNPSICDGEVARFWAQVDLRTGIRNPRYQWLLNGNPISNANALNLTVNSFFIGDTIQMIMTYDDDCQSNIELASERIGIEVNPLITPDVFLTADRTNICEGEAVNFSVSGNNFGANPTFSWSIDGQTINGSNSFLSLNSLRDGQEVNVIVTPDINCPAASSFQANPIGIEVGALVNPEISIERLGDEKCEGDLHSFTSTIRNGGDSPIVEWMIDGQKTGAVGRTFTTNSLLDGQVISAELISNANCLLSSSAISNDVEMSLISYEVPEIRLMRAESIVCPGNESNFHAIGIHLGTAPSYTWYIDGEIAGSDTSVLSQVLDPGQEVSCIVTSNRVCLENDIALSDTLTSRINDLLIEVIEIAPASCTNDNGYVEVQGIGGIPPYQYRWSNNLETTRLEGLEPAVYEVTVTDMLGCEFIQAIEILGETMPELNELTLEQPNCFRSNGNATARIENNVDYNYNWYNAEDDMISEDFFAFDLEPGTYELIVSTKQGCTTSYPFEIFPEDQLLAQLPVKVQTRESEGVELHPAIAPTRTTLIYNWFPQEGLDCTDCPSPIASPNSTTVYTLTISTIHGCKFSTEVVVEVTPNPDCYIPNIFSPNGDGKNDFFTIYGGNNTEEIVRMNIYDRWGNQAFGANNLIPDFEQGGWDGTLKGKKVPAGVYVYDVEVRFKSGRIQRFTGDVTLVR